MQIGLRKFTRGESKRIVARERTRSRKVKLRNRSVVFRLRADALRLATREFDAAGRQATLRALSVQRRDELII